MSRSQDTVGSEVEKVVVIRKDSDSVLGTNKIVAPVGKSRDDGKELFVMNSVVLLSRLELAGEESDRMKLRIRAKLGKNST